MSIEQRTIEEIKNDIKIISSNKLNISQSKLLLMGFIYEIISDKDIFPKNSDLKEFINKDMRECTNMNMHFREYLFASRTLLASRVQKEVYKLDYNNIINLLDLINKKLSESGESETNSAKSLKGADKAIGEWRDYFASKEK